MTTGKISIITSLYRSEAHLPAYTTRVLDVAGQVQAAGLALEVVLVANDPTVQEQDHLRRLIEALDGLGTAIRLDVPRESLYASWNRGIAASSGLGVAIWNVDDARTADALVEGYRLINSGTALVDFPYVQVTRHKWLGLFDTERRHLFPAPYDPARITPRAGVSPFFMVARSLYEQAGPFNERFRISGDFEWSKRPETRRAPFAHGTSIGGCFFVHGTNLSGTRNPHEWVEHNLVLIQHGMWDEIRPVDPRLMRSCWLEWGSQMGDLPSAVEERLWGPHAWANWRRWRQVQRRRQLVNQMRRGPRWIIDRLGLRIFLARFGLVKTVTRRR